jgi:hypothetical protein
MLVTFAGIRFEISEEWCDMTEDLDPEAPPTLARESGVGAIQFSVAKYVAKYKGGARPSITETDLKEMLSGLLKANELHDVEPVPLQGGRCRGVGQITVRPDEIIAAWYLSNGADVALVT